MCNKMLCLEIQYPYYDAIHAMVTNVNKSIKKKKIAIATGHIN